MKNGRAAHVRTNKVFYARTRTHIFKAPSAPNCTKIAALARVRARTLKFCNRALSGCTLYSKWLKIWIVGAPVLPKNLLLGL